MTSLICLECSLGGKRKERLKKTDLQVAIVHISCVTFQKYFLHFTQISAQPFILLFTLIVKYGSGLLSFPLKSLLSFVMLGMNSRAFH